MVTTPILSIISVNYNGLSDTLEMLQTVYQYIDVPFEVIVVDNGSKADEHIAIKQAYPAVNSIRSEQNLGFAGGNNVGIRAAKGKYLFFLNNDTKIEATGIKHCLDILESNQQIGGLSPLIRFAAQPCAIQFAGYTPLSAITLRNRLIGFGEQPSAALLQPSTTPYLHGAAMIVKREAIEAAGMMPEMFFLYYEELDWSMRIREKGYTLYYDPAFCVYHKESQSTGVLSPLKSYYMSRNRLLFAWRNLPKWQKYLSLVYLTTIVTTKDVLLQSLHRRFGNAKATIKGVISFYKLI